MVGGLGKGKGGVSLGIGGVGGGATSTASVPKPPALDQNAAAAVIQNQWAAKKEADAVRKEVSGIRRASSVREQAVEAALSPSPPEAAPAL